MNLTMHATSTLICRCGVHYINLRTSHMILKWKVNLEKKPLEHLLLFQNTHCHCSKRFD